MSLLESIYTLWSIFIDKNSKVTRWNGKYCYDSYDKNIIPKEKESKSENKQKKKNKKHFTSEFHKEIGWNLETPKTQTHTLNFHSKEKSIMNRRETELKKIAKLN